MGVRPGVESLLGVADGDADVDADTDDGADADADAEADAETAMVGVELGCGRSACATQGSGTPSGNWRTEAAGVAEISDVATTAKQAKLAAIRICRPAIFAPTTQEEYSGASHPGFGI